jgi:hypothetical protein
MDIFQKIAQRYKPTEYKSGILDRMTERGTAVKYGEKETIAPGIKKETPSIHGVNLFSKIADKYTPPLARYGFTEEGQMEQRTIDQKIEPFTPDTRNIFQRVADRVKEGVTTAIDREPTEREPIPSPMDLLREISPSRVDEFTPMKPLVPVPDISEWVSRGVEAYAREFFMPGVRSVIGPENWDKHFKPHMPEEFKDPETKWAPKAGEIIVNIAAIYAGSAFLGGMAAKSAPLQTLSRLYPRTSQALTRGTTFSLLRQIGLPYETIPEERRKVFVNNLPSDLAFVFSMGMKNVPTAIGTAFTGQFVSSKLEGKDNTEAFKESLTMSAIVGGLKVATNYLSLTDMQKFHKKQAANQLGIKETASQAEATKAFRSLARKYHPDRPGGSIEKMTQINQAIEVFRGTHVRPDSDIITEMKDMWRYFNSPEGKRQAMTIIRDMPIGLQIRDISKDPKMTAKAQELAKQGLSPDAIAKQLGVTKPAVEAALGAVAREAVAPVAPELLQEARKYKSAEEFVEKHQKVYHGGAGVDELMKDVKILSPEEKLKFPSSGAGYVGLSTTTDKSYAQEFSRNIAGTDKIAELYISPTARIKNISGSIDEMSPDRLRQLSNDYDVLKSVEDNELRVFNKDVIKTKPQLEQIWQQAQAPTPPTPRKLGITPEPSPFVKKREMTLLKDRIRAISKGAREGAMLTRQQITKAQKDLRDVIKESGLPAKERDKFEAQIRNIAKAKDPQVKLEAITPTIEARISKIGRSLDVDALRADISKTLKRFTPQKVKGVLKGKLTPEGQELVEIIRGGLNKTPEEALEKLQQNLEMVEKGVDPKMEAKLLLENESLGAAGSLISKESALDAGVERLGVVKQRLEEIISDPKIGLTERARQALNESEELERIKRYLTQDVTLAGSELDTTVDAGPLRESAFRKEKGRIMQFLDHNVNNLDFWAAKADSYYAESIPMRADLEQKGWWRQTRKLQEADRNYIDQEDASRSLAGDAIADNYKLKGDIDKWKLEREFNKSINLGTFKLRTGETKKITMTRGQLMSKYAQLQQEVGMIRLIHGNQWTNEIIEAVYKNMKPEDKKLVWRFIDEYYPKIREATNPIHEKNTGLRVGEEINYSPMPTKYAEELPDQLRMTLQEFQRRSTTPGAVKARADLQNIKEDAVVAPLEFDDFFMTARKHLIDMTRYQTFTEPIKEMRRVLTGDTRKALVQRFGQHFPQEMDKLLDQLASGAMKDTKNMSELWKLRSNFTTSVFALSPTRLFKEATSSILWAVELDAVSLAKATTSLFTKNLYRKTGKEMRELSSRIRKRYTKRTYDRDLSINAENKTALKLFTERQGAVDKSLVAQKAGDKTGIYSFGIPYYYHHKMRLIKSGVPEEEAKQKAIRFFEEAFKRNQVSGEAVDLGHYQRVGEIGPLFSQFKTAQMGLLRQEIHAIRSLGLRSRIGFKDAPVPKESILRNLVKLALIHLQFMLFQWVADGFRVDPERQKRAGLMGPFGAPIILGNAIETSVRMIVGDDVFDRGVIAPPGLSRVGEVFYRTGAAGRDILDRETGFDEWSESIIDVALSTGDLLGKPASNLRNLLTRGYQFTQGDLADWKQLIWSDYALDISSKSKTTDIPGANSILEKYGIDSAGDVSGPDDILKKYNIR